jgi:hypothetical protein
VEGWRPVEDLVRWGFAHSPVVMANEAHNGAARCVRTREVGSRMIRAAHEAGVRRLAMEALEWPGQDVQGPISALPQARGFYLTQPAAHGGTAGILRDQAPPPLHDWPGVDAVVVSADNALTGPRHEHPGSDRR